MQIAFERMQNKEDYFKYTKEELLRIRHLFEESFTILGGNIIKLDMQEYDKSLDKVIKLLK
jgi:hypothetical protein